MALRSLNDLKRLRLFLLALRRRRLARQGVVVHPTASISMTARLIAAAPDTIVIGADSLVAFKTLLLTRDAATGTVRPIRIGRNCFIGGGSVIMPGVTIGDGSIVGAGAIVTQDVPPASAVGGVPARVIRSGINVGRFGRLDYADANSRRLWR